MLEEDNNPHFSSTTSLKLPQSSLSILYLPVSMDFIASILKHVGCQAKIAGDKGKQARKILFRLLQWEIEPKGMNPT